MPLSLFSQAGSHRAAFLAQHAMPARIRDFDWTATEVGPLEHWPDEIRCVSRTMLMSNSPMAVLIGENGIAVYNDAIRPLFEVRYGNALGQPITGIFPETPDFYENVLHDVLKGRPHSYRDVMQTVRRDDRLERAWFDLDFTPIVDEHGEIHGVLLACVETTERVRKLTDLQATGERLGHALAAGDIVGTWEVDFATEVVRSDERYARLHGVDPELARTGVARDAFIAGIHPDDRPAVMAAFDRAKIEGQYRFQHRVVGHDGVRTIITSGRVFQSADGRPSSFSGIVVDITEQAEIAAALAASQNRFRTYTETLPHVVFSFDASGHTTYLNKRWFEYTGWREGASDPDAWADAIHPDDRPAVVLDWKKAIADGSPFNATARFRNAKGQYRWMHGAMAPIHDGDGRIASWIGTLTDVHEAKLLEQERELVSRELDHRIKNLFALVNSLVRLTAREARTVEAFTETLSGRLRDLHAAHEFIRPAGRATSGGGSSLKGILRSLLQSYGVDSGGGLIVIDGDDVAVDDGQVTAFALVIHELATNAAKYGALSVSGGSIDIHIADSESGLVIDWRERGKPQQEEPTERGFGSRLLSVVVEGQLRGHITRRFEADGLRITLHIPMSPA